MAAAGSIPQNSDLLLTAGTRRLVKPHPYGNCGGTHSLGKTACPARLLACHRCGKVGHLKRMCRGKGKCTVTAEDVEASGIVVAATSKAPAQP